MRKYVPAICIILFHYITYAQERKMIEVSTGATTYLKIKGTLPEEIDIGAMSNFIAVEQIEGQAIVKIIALKPFTESNLLIICKDTAFDLDILYREKTTTRLHELIYTGSTRVPNMQAITAVRDSSEHADEDKIITDTAKFKVIAELKRNQNVSIKKDMVIMMLDNIATDQNSIYFKFRIKNTSRIDYNIKYVKFIVESSKKGRKNVKREIELAAKASPYNQLIAPPDQDITLCFALKKFALRQNEETLKIMCSEELITKDARKMELNVKSYAFRYITILSK